MLKPSTDFDKKKFVEDGYLATLLGAIGAIVIGGFAVVWLSSAVPDDGYGTVIIVLSYYLMIAIGVAIALRLGEHRFWISTSISAGVLYLMVGSIPMGRLLYLPALLATRWFFLNRQR